ncbi:MAG: aspartate--tRNA ligase [Mariprofundaceae bacterium]|nr:aspartate--tRNA ligase [Mariprofundaceae bacterium]
MVARTFCGEFKVENIAQQAKLCGWVQTSRDHGGVIFLDIRDRSGLMQVVVHPEAGELHAIAHRLRQQDVLEVQGEVIARAEGTVNNKLATGAVELKASNIVIHNRSETPPFVLDDQCDAGEQHRLQYRYLDLRRPVMQSHMMLRHKVMHAGRSFLNNEGFIDVETPILNKSTPEGARDYLVPSRTHAGQFFALPQSPQIFKQLLMVAGMERYYQIARCFRDEDLRADRQPEFTQVDLEMSFVDQEDVMKLSEGLIAAMFRAGMNIDLSQPFPRITYAEAMDKYGSDKPDLRFDLPLNNISDLMKDVEFKVFSGPANNGGAVKVLHVPGGAKLSRKKIDAYTEFVGIYGARGLAWIKVNDANDIPKGLQSPIVKFLPEDVLAKILSRCDAKDGDILFFGADKTNVVNDALGNLRVKLGQDMGLIDPNEHAFVWVVDFPMFGFNEEEKRLDALHHPFTAPVEKDLAMLDSDPINVCSQAYDLVWNGTEIGGGSIRIHQTDVQRKVFNALGIDDEEADSRFGFLLDALKYGAPPHGGLAFGLDRVLALMVGADSIRDVMAFPKTQKAGDLMCDAPSDVDEKQLRELSIRLRRTVKV